MLRPRSGASQWISSEFYKINPTLQVLEYTDGYGNLCQRLIAPPGLLSIHTNANIHTSEQVDIAPGASFDLIQTLPDSVLTYLLPSRYCESDRFIDLAQDIVPILSSTQMQTSFIFRLLKSTSLAKVFAEILRIWG
jgi:hypothetical protein